MEKTTLYLPPRIQAELRALARRTGRSQAALIRDALEAYVAGQDQPWPSSIGIGADGSLDAENVEPWLAEHWEADLLPRESEAEASPAGPARLTRPSPTPSRRVR